MQPADKAYSQNSWSFAASATGPERADGRIRGTSAPEDVPLSNRQSAGRHRHGSFGDSQRRKSTSPTQHLRAFQPWAYFCHPRAQQSCLPRQSFCSSTSAASSSHGTSLFPQRTEASPTAAAAAAAAAAQNVAVPSACFGGSSLHLNEGTEREYPLDTESSILDVQPPAQKRRRDYQGGRGFDNNANSVPTKPTSVDAIVAEGMNNLSLKEREAVYNEIHGITSDSAEDPAVIQNCLEELHKELKKLHVAKRAYGKALFLNRAYVKNRDFELMFLRADQYDASKAARRLAYHFEKKLELFGTELFTKDITWNDLDGETVKSLRNKICFCSPWHKDSAGRALYVFCYSMKIDRWYDVSHARATWYAIMSCLQQDVVTQINGLAGVLVAHGATMQQYLDQVIAHQSSTWVTKVIPMRFAAIHLCIENESLGAMFATALQFLPTALRLRVRLHYGSLLECRYELHTFGIPDSVLPVLDNGRMDGDMYQEYIEKRERYDEEKRAFKQAAKAGDDTSIITVVHDVDVLCGRGFPFQNRPGTKMMMQLVADMQTLHEASGRTNKRVITDQVVRRVKDAGGRFLQKDGYAWSEVSDKAAHQKVAMGFRNLARKRVSDDW